MASHAAFSLEKSNKIKKEGVAEKVVNRILDLVRSGKSEGRRPSAGGT